MGLYDRDYIKNDFEESSARGRRFHAWQALIGINVVVWVLWLIAQDRGGGGPLHTFMREHFMTSLEHLKYGYVHTLLTSAISHMDLQHILFNMLALWIFGEMVEGRYGYRNTLGIYVCCGILSSTLHCFSYFLGPYAQLGPALGASGSVMGFAMIAAMLYPKRTFLFMFVIPMPLWLLVTIYIISDVAGIIGSTNSGIANFAHLGGAFAGFLMQKFELMPFNADRGETFKLFRGLRKLFRPKPKLDVVKRPPLDDMPEEVLAASRKKAAPLTLEAERPASREAERVDSRTAARVDEILQKISKEGMDSLTPEERAFMAESSKKYKK
jgi:membrane associated rhomboid family serine protease